MKKIIAVLTLLLLLGSSYLYADPWGSKQLNDDLQYGFITWITDAYSIVTVLLLLFIRSKSAKYIFLALNLLWFAAFILYSFFYYQSSPDVLHQRESEFRNGDYVWCNYYAIIAIGMVVTILYSLYYLYSELIRKKSYLTNRH